MKKNKKPNRNRKIETFEPFPEKEKQKEPTLKTEPLKSQRQVKPNLDLQQLL